MYQPELERLQQVYDADAIREQAKLGVLPRERNNGEGWEETKAAGGKQQAGWTTGLSNKRSVWSVEDEQMVLGWLMANHPDVAAAWHEDAKNNPDVWKVA